MKITVLNSAVGLPSFEEIKSKGINALGKNKIYHTWRFQSKASTPEFILKHMTDENIQSLPTVNISGTWTPEFLATLLYIQQKKAETGKNYSIDLEIDEETCRWSKTGNGITVYPSAVYLDSVTERESIFVGFNGTLPDNVSEYVKLVNSYISKNASENQANQVVSPTGSLATKEEIHDDSPVVNDADQF